MRRTPYPPAKLLDFYGSDEHFTSQLQTLHDQIQTLAVYTTECLNRIADEEFAYETAGDFTNPPRTFLASVGARQKLEDVFKRWCDYYVYHMEHMRQIDSFKLHQTNADGTRPTLRTSLCIEVFYEISRLFYLQHHHEILREIDNLQNYDEATLTTKDYVTLLSLSRLQSRAWIDIVHTFDPEKFVRLFFFCFLVF
jgi:hypothetical protein